MQERKYFYLSAIGLNITRVMLNVGPMLPQHIINITFRSINLMLPKVPIFNQIVMFRQYFPVMFPCPLGEQ